MFLAFSLLLVGWQACHAIYLDDYAIRHDAYATRSVQLPKGFSLGVATSSYQIEGAWNKDGKGENIWDRFLHTHRRYANGTNGDISANAYYKIKEDLELLNFLNVGHYKMSLSWSRLLPNGLITDVNQAAVDHYREQFKLLRKNQIEPFVTLYHWDLPQHLQDMGGFQNKSIVSWFADYARVAFDLFGDDVKYWLTFNDPYQICENGYGGSLIPPAVNKSGEADYTCGYNLLKAHAAAWHVYDKEFRRVQGGKISMIFGTPWIEPASDSEEDKLAAETQLQFSLGWFAHPIYKGDYPEVMKERVRERSLLQGLQKPRLPEFSRQEINFIKGTHDYFPLNNYGINVAKSLSTPLRPSSFQNDVGTKLMPKEGNPTYGMRKLLAWIKENYDDPSIFITENGYETKSATLDDKDRIIYIRKTLNNIFDAMTQDDVRVYGYCYWSLLDSFEWNKGYSVKYGLYAVDFKDPNRPRTPRKSALWYKHVCTTGCTGEKCPR